MHRLERSRSIIKGLLKSVMTFSYTPKRSESAMKWKHTEKTLRVSNDVKLTKGANRTTGTDVKLGWKGCSGSRQRHDDAAQSPLTWKYHGMQTRNYWKVRKENKLLESGHLEWPGYVINWSDTIRQGPSMTALDVVATNTHTTLNESLPVLQIQGPLCQTLLSSINPYTHNIIRVIVHRSVKLW